MGIRLNQLFIYKRTDPGSIGDFVEFWAARYSYRTEDYDKNINGPHTPEGVRELFKWKITKRFFGVKLPMVEQNFISRCGEAEKLVRELAAIAPRQGARRFLERFSAGGAVWRIFWLHCCDTRFPIYDQHVHRAMTFIEEGQAEELSPYPAHKKIQLYLDRYLPFFENFKGINVRKVDQALWQFGKSLKDSSLPRLRK